MDVKELINRVDIVEFISQFIDLEERNGEYWGLSCFKDEKTPSFSVRRNPPFFYDYSAGFGGNLFTFVKEYYSCSNQEAVNIIKKYAGISDDVFVQTERKLLTTKICKKFSEKEKRQKQSVATVLPENYMERYEKNQTKLQVWKDEGISDKSLEKFQVYYDSFSDRLVYPIRDIKGTIVNVGGRTLDPQWKEKKLRKYCYYYSWGTINTIYGIAENFANIKEKNEIIIFEGCKSVLIADTWGIGNCGAILTSHLSTNQVNILLGLGRKVVFALDKDVDVHNDKNINKLKQYINVEYIYDFKNLLDEKDSPVDKGKEVFDELYRSRIRYR